MSRVKRQEINVQNGFLSLQKLLHLHMQFSTGEPAGFVTAPPNEGKREDPGDEVTATTLCKNKLQQDGGPKEECVCVVFPSDTGFFCDIFIRSS